MMVNTDLPRPAGAPTLRGFTLEPVNGVVDPCWYRGQHTVTGVATILRRIEGIPFSDAVRDLPSVLPLLESTPPGVAPPLAVIVVARGTIVAGAAAASTEFSIEPDPTASAALVSDSPVDVWAVYADAGVEALAQVEDAPRRACEHLFEVAEVLDRLDGGHGVIDGPALRVTASGPLVLAVGLAPLEAARRGRFDAVGPWFTVAPERCLPPGLPTPRGDQYALATLWVAARTHRKPDEATSAEDFVRRKLTDTPLLDGLGAPEREVVARGLHASAESRYESSADFVAALLAIMPPEREKEPTLPVDLVHTTRPLIPDMQQVSMDGTAPLSTVHDPAVTTAIAEAQPTPTVVPETVSVAVSVAPPDEPAAPAEVEQALPEPPAIALATPPPASPASDVTTTTTQPVPQIVDDGPSSGALAVSPYKPDDLILPGYRLVRQLGKGGFGEVWRATAPGGLGVAIKVIANLAGTEGAKEFRALATIRDIRQAHIVPIFGVWLKASDGRLLTENEAQAAGRQILERTQKNAGQGGGGPLTSLELIVAMGLGDQTLYDCLKNRGTEDAQGVDTGQLLEWMRQAASAIDYFNQGHVRDGTRSRAVQHCDIKPQNMLLIGNMVWVCDFGLARVQGEAKATANNLLSVAYAAPEMMVRPFQPSSTTDQYGLAVSYYELRTGRLPYGDPGASSTGELSAVELMRAKTDGTIDVSLVRLAEQRVMRRALSLEPADRYGSCAEFVDQLRIAIESDTEPSPQATGTRWLKAAAVSAIGLCSVAAIAGALTWFRPTLPNVPAQPESVSHLQAARSTLEGAVTQQGEIDKDAIRRTHELIEAARRNGESIGDCDTLESAVTAVDRAVAAIQSATSNEPSIEGLAKAELAINALDEHECSRRVPEAARLMLGAQKQLARERLREQAQKQLDASVAEDGSININAVNAVRATAEALGPIDQAERERVESKLSSLVVTAVKQRLADHELVDSDSSPNDKRQVVETAIRDLKDAIRFDQHSWMAHSELGLCTYFLADITKEREKERYEDAVALYDKALHLLDTNGSEDSSSPLQILERRRSAQRELWHSLSRLSDEAWKQKSWDQCVAILDDMKKMSRTSTGGWQPSDGYREDRKKPHLPGDVLADLAWLVACGHGVAPEARAVAAASENVKYVSEQGDGKNGYVNAIDTLACAHARAGDFKEAVKQIERAIEMLEEPGFRTGLVSETTLEEKLELFRAGKPWDKVD
jgi:serine/threonine protein kinase